MANVQPPRKGCLKSAMVGIGCGCLFPAMFVLIFAVFSFFFLADPFRQLILSPEIPAFAGPEQENFWSLQEKRLDLENAEKPVLKLNPAEFNAWLSFLQFPPANGVCIHRCRFLAEKNGTFFLLCSGFFMRNLVIQIELSSKEKPEIATIKINKYALTPDSFMFKHAQTFIYSLIKSSSFNPVEEVSSGRAGFSFDGQGITLSGSLIR